MTELEYASPNGQDNKFKVALAELVGKVRFGWSMTAVCTSAVFLIASVFVNGGWLTLPAKELDMKEVKVQIDRMQAELKAVALTVIRLDEGSRAQEKQIDLIDRKLDRVIDQNLMYRAPPDSPTRKKPEDNVPK